ncbi:EC1118_1G1_5776p [Saccharomyces cerevisiae EC1118]|uniref:Putative uncharacterized protein YGR242W n=2 Tax=Saccharomyces cerevisiae TaxID=4932 RepID=YG55_YEAST|nr:RecName: Full=Putative uncharacterized protein YGR242W [Saccharomyces cerevisiae S288C]AAT93275.1 YGR242W [Saccharomyces cerevisiae]CAA97271.1 unnamed protein product [Saccharomyces cerevisiae]CAY80000.1 EC1118_1G1_5776p [Saccharomyces cerevisiae EC1118]
MVQAVSDNLISNAWVISCNPLALEVPERIGSTYFCFGGAIFILVAPLTNLVYNEDIVSQTRLYIYYRGSRDSRACMLDIVTLVDVSKRSKLVLLLQIYFFSF